jgi:hypothetical protein
VTDLITAENVGPTRFSVDGTLLEPDQSAEVAETDAVRELAASGALRLTRKPKTTPKRGPRRSPDGEE